MISVTVHDAKGFPLDLDLTVQGDRVRARVGGGWPIQEFYIQREDAASLLGALNEACADADSLAAQGVEVEPWTG